MRSSLQKFVAKSRLAELKVEASNLIEDTIESLCSKYENNHVDERTLRAIAPLVEQGVDSDVLLARLDFDFFCTQISPVFKPTAHHQPWNKALITEQSNNYLHRIAGENTSILAPRGASKSTKLGLFCAWAIGIHAEQKKALQMLYISANRELALAKSETIRNIITTDGYQKIFDFVQPHPKKWASPLWSIDRAAAGIDTTGQEEFTMIAAGILGTIASKRTNIICYDDLVKNAEDIASPAVRRKIVRTHYSVVSPTLFPGGRIIAINTRYRPDDIHVTDFVPSKGWDVLEQSAIIPRRELIRLGNFKERSTNKSVDTSCLDEAEAMAITRQEEVKLAVERLKVKQAQKEEEGGKEEGKGIIQGNDISIVCRGVVSEVCDGVAGGIVNGRREGGENEENENGYIPESGKPSFSSLSEQLGELQRYGVEVKTRDEFDNEDAWEEYLDEEVSYWEEMWSLEYLQGRRAADAVSFVYQYQNKIERIEGLGIPAEHIKYGRPPREFDYYCIGGDLATSKSNKADYTVFCLVGKRDSEYWILDYWRGKVTGNLKKIEHILDLYENWVDDAQGIITPWRIALEKVAYQASISDDLTRELYHKRALSHIVVMPTQLKGGKMAHIESVTGAFANGLVAFNEGIEWGAFVEELQGLGSHDDCVDALVIALQTLGVRRRLATIDTAEEIEKIRAGRDYSSTQYNDPYHGRWI